MNITIKQLETFLAVAKYENLVQASEELFITKGAISQSLQELEKQLNVKLFDRIPPHIKLNYEGKRLRPLADDIIRRCREIENIFQNEKDTHLKIGVSKTIGTYILPKLFARFQENFHWLPEAHIANSSQLIDELLNFSLDAILIEGYANHPDLKAENWLKDELTVIAPKNHPLADGNRHSLKELRNEAWILREESSGTRRFFENEIGQKIYPYKIAQILDSPSAVLGMVEQGIGITLSSNAMCKSPDFADHYAKIKLEHKLSRTLSICYHAKKYHSHSMDQFLNFCRVWQI